MKLARAVLSAQRASLSLSHAQRQRGASSLALPLRGSLSLSGPSAASVSASLSPSALRTLPCSPSLTLSRSYSHTHTARESEKAEKQRLSFQAETRKLLDIVTHSIYTDKEVFLRELVSNASDALEKFRYFQVTGKVNNEVGKRESPLQIEITADPERNTLTIRDTGVGMTRDELVANLGTIARSGSKQFVESLAQEKGEGVQGGASASKEGIIGQFGVGFYSSFMVSDRVSVESRSAVGDVDSPLHRWSSDGSGEFEIERLSESEAEKDGLGHHSHGSTLTLYLKKECAEFSQPDRIKSIIKHYSSFVSFPIKVNGEVVNSVSAIWTKDKRDVTEEQYNEFYRFLCNAYDTPKYRLHFRTDAPIDLKVLLYVPAFHMEKFGQGVIEPGVSLYSRRVLIEQKPRDLLPDWLRFVKGVVDSEDLPLSLSREKPQDSQLLRRLRDVLTRKLLKFFEDELRNDRTKYNEFYQEHQIFLKQGVCQDYKHMDQLAKLLLFESSSLPVGEITTLDEYVSRSAPEQKEIYYLVAPNRAAALASPYYETFKKHNKEVLLMYNAIDDFVMGNLKQYSGRTLVSAETSAVDFKDEDKDEGEQTTLTKAQSEELCAWLSQSLGASSVREVRITHRLSDSPAIVTDHESGALRRMMRLVEQSNAGKETAHTLPPQILEINPSHPLIHTLYAHKDDPRVPTHLVAQQLFDNALIAAGLLEDPRAMLPRLQELLLASLHGQKNEKKE